MKLSLVILTTMIVGSFMIHVNGLYVKINPTTQSLEEIDVYTYFLPDTPRNNYGLWPNPKDSEPGTIVCEIEFDAHFSPTSNLYSVTEWFRAVQDFGDNGSIIYQADITDLQTFVSKSFQLGVWSSPLECAGIWDKLREQLIKPVIMKLGTFNHDDILFEENGILYKLLCQTKDDMIQQQYCQTHGNHGCSASEIAGYHPCTSNTFLSITQSKKMSRSIG